MGILLVYVVQHYVKAHILLWYLACLNLVKEIFAIVPIFDTMSNLQKFQDWLNMKYVNSQCDTCKNDKA